MFYGSNNITEIDLSNFKTAQVNSMQNMFKECINLRDINFGNIDTSKVTNMEGLFRDCKNLRSIDLSNFDTSSLENAKEMFSSCFYLTSLNLSNFKTSKLKNIYDMFCNCQSLKSIDLSNFDTSNVENMRGLFFGCVNLKYADLQNFSGSSLTNFVYVFGNCPNLLYVNMRNFKILNSDNIKAYWSFVGVPSNAKFCIEDSTTINYLFNEVTVNCSDFCFEENVLFSPWSEGCYCNDYYKFEYNNKCYNKCPQNMFQLEYYGYICIDSVPENYYLDNNDNIYKKCFQRCKNCNQKGNETNNNCNECIDNYKFIIDDLAYANNCYENCEYNYYFTGINQYECTESNECPSQYNKLIISKNKCIDDCQKDNENIYDYKNNCLNECPVSVKNYEEQKLCLDECYTEQFEYNNICYNDCPTNTFRIFINRNMCVDVLPENYYLDENDNIYKKCYDRCKTCKLPGNENIHNCDACINGFSFINDTLAVQNNCYNICDYYYYFDDNSNYECTQSDECPLKYNNLIKPKNKCIDDCKNDPDYIFQYNSNCLLQCLENLKIDVDTKHCLENCYDDQIVFNEMCYNEFPEDNPEFFQDGNIFVNNLTNFDDLLNNIILSAYSPEEGNKLVIQRPDEIVYQITNSINELDLLKDKSKNTYNISIIDLGYCESLLKKENNISENDSLIFIKSEIKTNKVSEKNVKYDAYNPYNKEKLNLSICEEVPVNIYFPMELSKGTKQIYDQMKNSGYDMFNLNDPFYQDICTPFDSGNGTDIILSDRIDYIYNNDDTQCQSNCQYSQYSIESQYLTCSCSINENVTLEHKKNDKFNAKKIYEIFYEVLKYSNYDIIKCYNVILNINVIKINMGSIIVIFYFFCFLMCFFIFIFRGIIPLKIKLRYDLYQEQKRYNLVYKFNIYNILYPPIKKNYQPKFIFKKVPQNNNNIMINKNIIKFNQNNKSQIQQKPKLNSNSNSNSFANVLDNIKIKILYKKKIKGTIKYNKKEAPKKTKREYSDYELNELEFEEAKKLDRRSLCKVYWQTLQREHLIFFTFFNCNDYNLLSVKISRFVHFLIAMIIIYCQ